MIDRVDSIVSTRLKEISSGGFDVTREGKAAFNVVTPIFEQRYFLMRRAFVSVGTLGSFLLERESDEPELGDSHFLKVDSTSFLVAFSNGCVSEFSEDRAKEDISAFAASLGDSSKAEFVRHAKYFFQAGYGYFRVALFADSMKGDPSLKEAADKLRKLHPGWALTPSYVDMLVGLSMAVSHGMQTKVGQTAYGEDPL